MKRKHADLIHAWADGAEIQIYSHDAWYLDETPMWHPNCEYRIKPEEKKPVVRWLWATKSGSIFSQMATEYEATMNKMPLVKLEWSRTEFPE